MPNGTRPLLDDVSKRIIEQLQEDGRRAYATIGKAVGLSEAAVRQRVQRLVESGVIQIVAVTDPLQVGFTRQAMIGVRSDGDLQAVAEALGKIAEVDYLVITAGSFDILLEVVCEDDDHLLDLLDEPDPHHAGRPQHRDLRLPQAPSAALRLGNPMSTSPAQVTGDGASTRTPRGTERTDAARDHLWMHFTRHSTYETSPVPVMVRGEGVRVFDQSGKSYLDGLSGLFVVQVGHGRTELAEAAAKQAAELAFFPLWSYAHPVGDRPRGAAGRRTPPPTSTGCSSPPAAARRSRPRGSWPSSTSSSPASPTSTR